MPGFVRYDLDEFSGATHVAFHEGGHILTAYHYGFHLRTFSFREMRNELAGSFGCDVNPLMNAANPEQALLVKAIQLLAAEVAARRRFGFARDEVVLPVHPIHTVHAGIPLDTVISRIALRDRDHDVTKVLNIARTLGKNDWWPWFWNVHNITIQVIDTHYQRLKILAERLLDAKPFDGTREKLLGTATNFVRYLPGMRDLINQRGSGSLGGFELIRVCRKIGIPLAFPEFTPEAG